MAIPITVVEPQRGKDNAAAGPRSRKRRHTTWEEKLRALDPSAPSEQTEVRLQYFGGLFVQKYTDGITTRVNQGPRSWIHMRGRICVEHVARHLLGDRIHGLPPIWIGARSFATTRWFCLDVDPDRTAEQTLVDNYDLSDLAEDEREDHRQELLATIRAKRGNSTPTPFAERCHQVERALRLLGLDPRSPTQVTTLPSPSGGRHYYVFLDRWNPLTEIKSLLQATGLSFAKGQFELFPSTSQGFRLPFGKDQQQDPIAWRRFTDDYTQRRIRRHSISKLREHLDAYLRQLEHRAPSATGRPQTRHTPRSTTRSEMDRRPTFTTVPRRFAADYEWYAEVVERGPRSREEAERLWETGIMSPGTRTAVLNYLAQDQIWHRHKSVEVAVVNLSVWATNPRHQSKDIQKDLARGTQNVPKQVDRMCRWYAEHKRITGPPSDKISFAANELTALRGHVQAIPPGERTQQAHFSLRFLWFARRCGTPLPDGTGWEAAVAITAVVKKWPGCRHGNDYKKRFDRAMTAGVLTIMKEKWQNPNGKGRARTYLLAVPIAPEPECVIDYDTAIQILTDRDAVVHQVKEEDSSQGDHHERQIDAHAEGRHDEAGLRTPVVHPAGTGKDLAESARERPAEPDALAGLYRPPLRARGAVSPRSPDGRDDIVELVKRDHEAAKSRNHKAMLHRYGPKTLDGRILPPPEDTRAITEMIESLKDELDQQFPGQGTRDHPNWQFMAAIAGSFDYSIDERQLILSNPAKLSPQWSAPQKLVQMLC